mgnify:CR=1 FL=1
MTFTNTAPPELLAQWEKYIKNYLRNEGIGEDASADVKAKALRRILDEAENGMTIQPDGEITYLASNPGENSSSPSTPASTRSRDDSGIGDKKAEIIKQLKLPALALIALTIFFLISNIGKLSFGSKNAPSPTPLITEELSVPVNYSIAVSNSKGEFISDYDEPETLSYNGVDILVKKSDKKMVERGDIWCKLDEATPNSACWLGGSIINTVIGMKHEAFGNYFGNAKVGDTITVKFGGRRMDYIISSIETISLTDTDIVFSQRTPVLSLVFFGQRDEDGNLLNIPDRKLIVAKPDQQKYLESVAAQTDSESVPLTDYIGDNTAFKIGNVPTNISLKSFAVEGQNWTKVSFYIQPVVPSDLAVLASYIYTLDSYQTYPSSEQQPDPATGMFKVSFYVQGLTTTPQNFTLIVQNSEGESFGLTGQIARPQPMQYVAVDVANIRAEYQPASKMMVVHIPYTMLAEASPELCTNCSLMVNGNKLLPDYPVYFSPQASLVDAVYSNVNINLTNMSGLKIDIGNNSYELVMAGESEDLATPTEEP